MSEKNYPNDSIHNGAVEVPYLTPPGAGFLPTTLSHDDIEPWEPRVACAFASEIPAFVLKVHHDDAEDVKQRLEELAVVSIVPQAELDQCAVLGFDAVGRPSIICEAQRPTPLYDAIFDWKLETELVDDQALLVLIAGEKPLVPEVDEVCVTTKEVVLTPNLPSECLVEKKAA